MKLRRLLWTLGLGLTMGCTHSIHQVQISDYDLTIKEPSTKLIEASTEQWVFLGFTRSTDYVDQAYAKLKSECPSGKIYGISTQYSTSHGFFSWTNKILMRGHCGGAL